jgi:amino acid adenylation domain-containing protein
MYKRKISDKLKIAANQKLKERDYWIKTLSGESEKTYFYYDKLAAGEAAAEDAYQAVTFNYENELWQQLMKLSNNADSRLHMILVAGVVALLHKYTGDSDIIVGSPIYKQEQDIEFINTVLPLRNQIEPSMTFKQLLLQVRQVVIDAMENQNYPIEILLENLGLSTPETENPGTDFPLFDVMILVENIHDKKYIQHIPTNTIFSFLRTDHSLQGVLTYNVQRYETSKMQRLITHLTCLLREVLANIDKKISSFTILSLEEKNQILFEFNNTKKDLRRDICYHQLFEKQVAGNPNKIVAVDHLHQITYNKLNEEANRIAHFLIRQGLRADTIAAIYMDRSVNMLAAIIGIFKAGGVYLGIDIALPEGRIRNILEDSKVKTIITDTENLGVVNQIKERLPHLQTVLCWKIDNKGASIDILKEYPIKNPAVLVSSSSLAYIIYTSGTTGKPKGVMIHQLGMINHLYAIIDFLGITGGDTIAQSASLSFDISVWQFLAAPILGGGTYIIGYEVVLDPIRLLRVLQKGRITILEAVPSLMSALLETVEQEGSKDLKDLRWMLPTGEALSVALANKWYGYYPGIKLVNAYGPTEASDDVTLWALDAAALEKQRTIPIGKPLPNLHVYIMGTNLSLCPVRVPGEICIAGIGIGKGYLNDPGKTAKSFLPNPYVGEIGDEDYSTLYKTGDMGYFTEDGNIEFLGRQDYQVKVRGFRIELEEIEHQLMHLDEIKEAVVVPRGESDDKYLCAYIVSNTTSPLSISKLRDSLSQELPYYMIPSYFLSLDKIPLTPNGKIDRKALPDPEIKTGREYIEPRNEMEKKMIKIWSEILEVDEGIIGIDTNFFELGGHSLKAILFISKIHKELNVIVPLADIFKYQTIRGLSDYIKSAEENKFETIAPVEKKEYYEVSPAQRRIYLTQQLDKNSIAYNLPFVITLENVIDKKREEDALKKLVERHESLRTSFEMIDKELVQEIHREVDFQVKFYRTGEEKKIKQLIKNFVEPFDLSHAPILRVGLIEITEEKNILMFDIHHIICDGVSGDVLAKDFIEINNGKDLAPLRIQYKDFSHWQNRLFQSERLEKQKKYWLQQFERELPVLDIPCDFERPPVQGFAGDIFIFEINKKLSASIKEMVLETKTTLYMLLLAIFNILLAKYTAQEDIIIGTGVAGRTHVDLEKVIGMFINMLAMRNSPTEDKTFRNFLEELKENTLNAYENQDYPFDDLVRQLRLQGDVGRNPLFDVVFQVTNIDMNEIKGTGNFNVTSYETDFNYSHFDLLLNAVDADENISMSMVYSTALFKKSTIEKMSNHFMEILDQVIKDNYIKLKDITISHDLLVLKSNIFQGEQDQEEFEF